MIAIDMPPPAAAEPVRRPPLARRSGPPDLIQRRAAAYLATKDPAISGQGGHVATFNAACDLVVGFELAPAAALELLERDFNPRCEPPWTRRELEHKIATAARDCDRPRGYLLVDGEDRRPPPISSPDDEDEEREAIRSESPPAQRPTIQIGHELHSTVDASIVALRGDPDLFQRDGSLVSIVHVAESEASEMIVAGTPTIRRLAPATIRERLTKAAIFERFDGRSEEWKRGMPSEHIVQAVAARGQWPGLRPIVGVLETPALRPDGSVIQARGYDRATGYFYSPNDRFLSIPGAPTQADAKRALDELVEVFVDFPYRGDADRMVPIAALLTLLARPAIRGSVPGFLFDATTPGSGKTLQSDSVAILATGRTTAKMSYPGDETELEKVLGSYALRGARLVNFDNVTAPFGGGPLDRVLTAEDTVELRVLGKSEVPALCWRAVVMATGNNIVITGDTARRVLVSRIESLLEHPESRTAFKHPDLLGWLRVERPRLVAAALTILRAFVVARRPRGGCPAWGSFEPWASLVPPAIVFAGGADPLATRATASGVEDPEAAALRAILEHLPRLDVEGRGVTAKSIVERLYTVDRLRGAAPPDGFDELREAFESLVPTMPGRAPDTKRLGNKFRKFLRRVVGARRLDIAPGRSGTVRWRVVGLVGLVGHSQPFAGEMAGHLQGDGLELSHQTHQTHHGGDYYPEPAEGFDGSGYAS